MAAPAKPTIDDAARLYAARDFAATAQTCRALLRREPRHFDALHLLGVLCLNDGQRADAVGYLRRAEQQRPDVAALQLHLGNALLALRMFDAAETAFRRSLALRPDDFDALNNLGNTLAGVGRHGEAIECFRQALTLHPDAPPPRYNLSRSLLALDRPEEASDAARAALQAAGPDTDPARLVDLRTSLCETLIAQCRYDEALVVCRDAPAGIADAPAMQWNEGLTLLVMGEFAAGWEKYDSRFLVPGHDVPRAGAVTLDLDVVAGRRVLVFPEQGRGDMIHFARYLPLLAARGATVLVESYADLQPLFETIDGVARVVTPDDDPPAHDLLTPMISLPRAFGTTLQSVPADVPYLRVPRERLREWCDRLGESTVPRIGIAWSGSEASLRRAALPAAMLEPLVAVPGTEFHLLQKEVRQEDAAWLREHGGIVDHRASLRDFADTAALIAQMDLVISVDTAVAHLAGALGVPVWIMLSFSPDWRWLQDRDDSPWYPTARLFRQTTRGDWHDVVRRVAEELSASPVIARSEATKQSPAG